MTAPPAISVLMSVRNGATFLDGALASLAAQTFRDFEILLIENGSSDGTAEIVAAWEAREPRLRVFRIPELGLSRNVNFAASQAQAPLLARLDADDVALPGRLAAQHEAMAARPRLGLLGGAAEVIDPRGRRLGVVRCDAGHAELKRALRQRCAFVHSTTMFRAEAFRRAGGYRPGLNVSEDYDLWCRLAEQSEIANLPDLLVRYRLHKGSVTSRHPERVALARLCVAAGRQARAAGRPEPFAAGTPSARLAGAELGLTRERLRQIVRLMAWRSRLGRRWFALPLPRFLKTGVRRAADRLRLRPVYLFLLRLLAGAPERDPGPPPPEAPETPKLEAYG